MNTPDETATCRGCRKVLRGKPYYMGGSAYHPVTGEQCPANFYGGFVCSEDCDRRASHEQEASMPGANPGPTRFMSTYARSHIARNWAA